MNIPTVVRMWKIKNFIIINRTYVSEIIRNFSFVILLNSLVELEHFVDSNLVYSVIWLYIYVLNMIKEPSLGGGGYYEMNIPHVIN